MSATVTSLTLTRGQVAAMLGITEGTFRKRQAELEGFGFPRKLPGLKTWSRPAVADWIRTNGHTYASGPRQEIDPVSITLLDEATAELQKHYAEAV